MKLLVFILAAMLDFVPVGKAYLTPLQPRDSILIADQLEYGFQLDSVKSGTMLALPDFSAASNDTLTLVRNWQLDTVKVHGKRRSEEDREYDIRAHIVLAAFEEGTYVLPSIPVARMTGRSQIDTLIFEGLQMEVKTMPVDTATFVINDIKGQMRYPLTFKEVLPWMLGALLLAGLVMLTVRLVRRRRAAAAPKVQEPAYIVALRELDKYRGDKFWAPEKQKLFYSGITDTLKAYIDARFGVDAPEMTTAELFAALKSEKSLTPELFDELKQMFETADFVKFAKFTAGDEDNARALPLAVRFVTETYQIELEEEQKTEHDV